MDDADKLDLVHKAIRSGIFGHIQWKDAAAHRVRNDHNLCGLSPEGIRRLLREFVMTGGGVLEARQETRAEYVAAFPFWYRAVINVPDLPRGLFLEMLLVDDNPDEPWVEIVSAHLQTS